MTLFFACTSDGWQHHDSEDWGPCRRLIEVLDDQMAGRQVDLYRSGQVLVYDRDHPRDEFGILIGCRFSRKEKWKKGFRDIQLLSPEEFEREWQAARSRAVQQANAADGPSDRR